MINRNCPICGPKAKHKVVYEANFSETDLNVNVFSARRMPDRIHYGIVRCEDCDLVYSTPTAEDDTIFELYKKSKMSYADQIEYLRETYGSYIKKIAPHLPSRKRFLEIGCGNGFMLQEAKESGFEEAYGVEPSIEAVNSALPEWRNKIVAGIFKDNLFKNDSFDMICFFQTFDHISEPNKFLQGCFKCLKPGGVVLVINHNIGALTAKLLGERCPMIDIEHPVLYDKKTFAKIFLKNGFDVRKVFDVKNNYPLSYWSRIAPLPGFMKKILAKSTIRIKLNAGNMGLIATK